MGIDPAHILNHDFYFRNTDEMLLQLQKQSGLPVFVGRSPVMNKDINSISTPAGFKGWTIYTEDNLTMEETYKNDGMLSIYLDGVFDLDFELYLEPHCIQPHYDDFYMGRWSGIKYMAELLKENGIPTPGDYEKEELHYFFKNRKRLYEYSKNWGSHTMITFCSDKHGEWLDYFFEEKWTFEQFVEWGKRDFIFVDFKDLPQFTFPEKQPDYWNVFIYDGFDDLKK